MKIEGHEMTFTLTVQEVSVWMSALRSAAKHSVTYHLKSHNPFANQHQELVRLTGYCEGDHKDLMKAIE